MNNERPTPSGTGGTATSEAITVKRATRPAVPSNVKPTGYATDTRNKAGYGIPTKKQEALCLRNMDMA